MISCIFRSSRATAMHRQEALSYNFGVHPLKPLDFSSIGFQSGPACFSLVRFQSSTDLWNHISCLLHQFYAVCTFSERFGHKTFTMLFNITKVKEKEIIYFKKLTKWTPLLRPKAYICFWLYQNKTKEQRTYLKNNPIDATKDTIRWISSPADMGPLQNSIPCGVTSGMPL